MTRLFTTEKDCKHDGKFFCTAVSLPNGDWQHAFACDCICGFWIPFDPEFAGKITEKKPQKNPIVDMWRLNTVAFLPEPAPRAEGWKDGPRLSTYNC
jgi:hypothetical protein